ncbi:uncharacterized protein LOC105841398 isoform X1 [Bombyx mori]|uniref:Uncharacterized protein n=1 Tax=Bombyx mori TaxID=7091 RepID=A0A8R2M943_BOMMO|nr:uncharacterized protein LOC105841398 isoform X1 [Bombyx mori]
MAAVNSVQTSRLPLPRFSPRAVLMYSAAVGGEGAVALQLREAAPGELDAARLHDERLAIACHEPELLADLLHAAADIDGEQDGLTALLAAASPDLALASDASDSLPLPDHDHDCTTSLPTSSGILNGIATVSVAVTGLEAKPPFAVKKVRPKPASPNRQGPQQCQVCNKIFGNASALAKHKLTHSDERKYVCITCAKAFKRQDHLNGHMLTHRNKKPYECKADGCGKSYCDARSLRRHTENHHHPPADGKNSNSSIDNDREPNSQRVSSPISPGRSQPPHSDSSNGSEKSSAATSGSGGGSDSPPCTPPTPVTPPVKQKTKAATKPKSCNAAQQGNTKCGGGASASGSHSSTASGPIQNASRTNDVKPVECNLCHRKFKNIPALNGHMRLHGGYFKKDSDSKKLDKKETTGPPLQTASVSVRALIEEKIISRRGATASSTNCTSTDTVASRSGFVAPAPPPLSTIRASSSSPATTSAQFVPPRAPSAVTVAANLSTNMSAAQRDSTLIELLKKGNTKAVKRSASDPGHASPQQDYTFRPELFGVSFNSDDGYFSPALNDDTFQFTSAPDQLEDLASLEDYATVAASIRERSPVTFPYSRRLAAVLNSPLPESLADFGACHGGSPVTSPGIGYTANSPGLSYTTGDSPGLAYTAASPGGSYSTQPSPGFTYPTPPASHDAHSPAHTVPRASSPLSAAFFTATMSSQEEVEEALEEVLPEECRSLDAYSLEPSQTARRIMLNSEDPLLSSSPRDFSHQRIFRRQHRSVVNTTGHLQQWQHDNSLQVCVEGRDTVPAVFLSPNSVPASPQRRKRRASPAGPYRSRMRRAISHFTPQPMLPPERDGSGLYIDLTAGILSENDGLSQTEDVRKPQINIGTNFQAELPELYSDRDDLHRAPEQLLWDPGINEALEDNEVRMFMELAMCAAMPVGGHTREFALQTLGECGGDIRAATLRLMSRPVVPSQHESRWAPDEVEAFLSGLSHYDKDFFRISQLVRTKDSKQCVQFYYFWKKVTKDYKTQYLRSWCADPHTSQGSVAQVTTHSNTSCTSSPTSYDNEEYPCKICGKVFNKVKSRSAHMKSHRPLDAETKKSKLEKPYEKAEKSDGRHNTTNEFHKTL